MQGGKYGTAEHNRLLHGFTIVELLVVIVVIGILAGIVVVAYNGIQDRAQSAKAASALDSYIKAFQIYYSKNGAYPNPGTSMVCLGNVADYPADSTFAAGECYGPSNGSGKGTTNIAVNATLNNALTPYLSPLPDASLPKTTSGYTSRGFMYTMGSSDYTVVSIMYFLVGSGQSCGNGTAVSAGSMTTCYVNLSKGIVNP